MGVQGIEGVIKVVGTSVDMIFHAECNKTSFSKLIVVKVTKIFVKI